MSCVCARSLIWMFRDLLPVVDSNKVKLHTATPNSNLVGAKNLLFQRATTQKRASGTLTLQCNSATTLEACCNFHFLHMHDSPLSSISSTYLQGSLRQTPNITCPITLDHARYKWPCNHLLGKLKLLSKTPSVTQL